MKPTLEELCRACPEADRELAAEHVARLDERYFELFDLDAVCSHLQALAGLSAEEPVRILYRSSTARGPGGAGLADSEGRPVLECTVLGFDYPGFFSLLTGLLSAAGFHILSGDVFTYAAAAPEDPAGAGRRGRRPLQGTGREPALRRRRIIDHLSGTLSDGLPLEVWENRLSRNLQEVARVLEGGTAGRRAAPGGPGAAEALQEARRRVNEQVAQALAVGSLPPETVLYPVQIEAKETGGKTLLTVIAQDTPFFLYALSTALSLRSIFIDYIRIRTIGERIEDEFSFLDARGRALSDPAEVDQVKLSVLLTKQFTYFLGSAPDPYAALCRFEQLVESVLSVPTAGRWSELLSDPRVLQDLARLLGASDFLWEDFIRLQYETLLPILEPHVRGRRFTLPPGGLTGRLEEALARVSSYEEKVDALNDFKDREIFLMELDHILSSQARFGALSQGLTRLAEEVVKAAAGLAWQRLADRYGTPRTVAGLPALLGIFGLGKLGGGELGYASDIELLFVFSDHGYTDGKEKIRNSEFFELLVREATSAIRAKKEGIFQVDLRLRPHGASGPSACSLESFCNYYGPEGEAHPLERLALVRLRAIGGDLQLGARVERLRDEMVYAGSRIELPQLLEARRRQLDERTRRGELNAKFSPGALLDLEYTVMLLQLAHASEHPGLRTPFLRAAIDELGEAGVLAAGEVGALQQAYEFLRVLINSLRMLRGSAIDLFLPALDSPEYTHLARRMGYRGNGDLNPSQKLHLDFETHTAAVRAFVEQHFGRSSLPVAAVGSVADLVLSEEIPEELRHQILARAGFRETGRAYRNLRSLAGEAAGRGEFARLAVLATDLLRHQPDPDMALNNWERFQRSRGAEPSYRLLLSQPRRLEILLTIFAGSQYLSDVLIRYPEFFEWATQPEHLQRLRGLEEMTGFFASLSAETESHETWRVLMRRFKKRELLRIGIRDICLGAEMGGIMSELSTLAQALVEVSLRRILSDPAGPPAAGFCILAFGKLGGEELNYSSDIDLLAVSEGRSGEERGRGYRGTVERLRADLADHLEDGQAYRVDLRLRPFGKAGELVASRESLLRYYREHASLWELQALLKARPVAGDLELGRRFLQEARALLREPRDPAEVIESIEGMRRSARRAVARSLLSSSDIKLGAGGIRDVEFLVQGLQLIHAPRLQAALLSGNTLEALDALGQVGVLQREAVEGLRRDYLFLRRIEHYLQLFENRQTHSLPTDPAALEALARRLFGLEATAEQFLAQVADCLRRVEEAYRRSLLRQFG
ncbi:MAG: glutamate-ammonia-ligase adenylyltransferase [Spirochaetales bacterium]|nr:glutamate-ammonia-ligase adenylyltransferase [Spirochaetales bacterium]